MKKKKLISQVNLINIKINKMELELEKTFLVKKLPLDLFDAKSKEIIDIYFPKDSLHPKLRLRKNGDNFELTKKELVKDDASEQIEHTIALNEAD